MIAYYSLFLQSSLFVMDKFVLSISLLILRHVLVILLYPLQRFIDAI